MKSKLLLTFFLFLPICVLWGRAQQPLKPLTRNQLMELVKAGMDNAQLAEKVRQAGINFDLTDDDLQALRKAGAQDVLIQALRALRPKPLTREQVLELVTGGVPSGRAAGLVKQRGVDFVPDADYLETLRIAGAEPVLLAALREAGAAVTGQLEVDASPGAEVSLDGVSQGLTDAQGHWTGKVSLGAHQLHVSFAGNKPFEQEVSISQAGLTRVQAQLVPLPGPVRKNPKDGQNYVWIPPGIFQMGCSPGDNDCSVYTEKPRHQVTLTRGYWLGQTEVTVGAYKTFLASVRRLLPTPDFDTDWSNDNMPMVDVVWKDASDYCGWMGGRLPSDAEWEYAARAGSADLRYGPIEEIAWFRSNSNGGSHIVGERHANAFGLFDMLGNVWEWVNDAYEETYYENSPPSDPTGPSPGTGRVVRGGAYNSEPRQVRASARTWWNDPGRKDPDVGFRCVWKSNAP